VLNPDGVTVEPLVHRLRQAFGQEWAALYDRGVGSDGKRLVISYNELCLLAEALHRPMHGSKAWLQKLLREVVSTESPLVKEMGVSVLRTAARELQCWGCLSCKRVTRSQQLFNGNVNAMRDQSESSIAQRSAPRPHGNRVPDRVVYPRGSRPWEVVQMDIGGPYLDSSFYWIALQDTWSRFVIVEPMERCPRSQDCERLLRMVFEGWWVQWSLTADHSSGSKALSGKVPPPTSDALSPMRQLGLTGSLGR